MSDARLTILFFVEHFRLAGSGGENDAVNLCRGLARRGHEVHVVADTADAFDDVVVHHGLDTIAQVVASVRPEVSVDWFLFHRADVHRLGGGVHREFLRYSLHAYPSWLRWLKRLEHRKPKHVNTMRREEQLLRNPDALFLAISDFVARQARAAGARADAVRVLHNAVDTVRFAPESAASRRGETRLAWGLEEHHLVFLFVAHNVKLKNLSLLRQVFGHLHQDYPAIRLVVVGKRSPGWTAPYLVYVGTSDAIEHFYGAADGLLHPSFFDSFGNVILEAMSCALPVICSDCSGACELIEHGRNGIVLPVTGPSGTVFRQWAEWVRKLADAAQLRQEIGQAARTTAEAHGFAGYVERFEQWLRHAARRKRERSS